MRTRAKVSAVFVVAILAILAASAQASSVPKPAWKLLAISAPTNLAPKQSEVQKLTVLAEGGTFRLSRKPGAGSGTPVTAVGQLKLEKENTTAVISFGSFEAGQRLTAAELPAETTVVSCSSDCATPGSTVTLSKAPTGPPTGTVNRVVKIFTKKLSSVTGTLRVGDAISGTGIAANTVITAVEGTTVTTNKTTTSAYTSGSLTFTITAFTDPLPYNVSAAELESAFDAMPAFAPGELTVTGGPGGDVDQPFFVSFGGSFANQNVEALGVDPGALFGESAGAYVITKLPGGPGTGTLVALPANIGAKATSGKYTVTLGPLPAGVVTAGPATGNQWECPGSAAGQSSFTCFSTRPLASLAPSNLPVSVPVEVQSEEPLSAKVPVEISGGGADISDSFELPLVVSNQDPAFDLSAIWAGAYEADGTPVTQAGAHPYSAASYFMVTTMRNQAGNLILTADPHETIVDLQPGFVGNPLATARCPQSLPFEPEDGESDLCNKENNAIGYLAPYVGPITDPGTFEETSLFNAAPPKGYAAAFSSKLVVPLQTIVAKVRSSDDYGVRLYAPNNANFDRLWGAFAAFEGTPAAGHGVPIITTGTACAEEARKAPTVELKSDSWQDRGKFAQAPAVEVPAVDNCEALEFKPIDPKTGKGQVGFSFQPTSTTGSSPVGATARLHIDQSGLTDSEKLGTPHLKRSVIKLPQGLNLNPSQSDGLEGCSEAQIGYLGDGFELPNPMRFNEQHPSCPDGSKLGTARVSTPLLEQDLEGTVYLAEPHENPFGSLIAIYLVVDDAKSGVMMKLPGEVKTDPVTGQITTVFDYSPQLPFEDLTLHLPGGGPRSPFATPEVCGGHSTEGAWTPWSAPESGPPAQTSDGFTVAGNCASSPATRPFSPAFEAGTGNPIAGAFAPLVIKVDRRDGEQELRQLNFTLPPGVTGKLAGVPYCPEALIAAAGAKTGKAEQASPSCPAASRIGSVDTSAGVGSQPFHVGGSVYLAGPYKGAPLSSVVITPAVAGPFDLGNVVIRAPIHINPETAQLTAMSDPIPTILEGIPLKVRSVAISIDRPQFGLNPTNCEVMASSAAIISSDGATAFPANRFQVGGCAALKFAPKLRLKLKGGTKRNANPALTAILTQAPGQANIGKVSVALPHSEFLDQGHIRTICTRVQFAADQCPQGSVYGRAEATSPLLDAKLTGLAYLRSSNNKLPDLVIALRGPAYQPVEIDLVGRIDSVNGGIRNSFELVPDAPVSRFVLRMQGGKKGLLVNSTNICRGKHRARIKMTGQNGKRHNFRTPLKGQCGKKKRKAGGHKRRRG